MSTVRYYSEAQLGVLATLGLVPWVQRGGLEPGVQVPHAPTVALPCDPLTPVPLLAPAKPSSSVVAAVAAGSPPEATDALGEWLAACPLAGFARRGERRFQTGPDDARVLVVAQAAAAASALLPLEEAEAALLKAMMLAIDLQPGGYATAVVVAPGDVADAAAPTVASCLEHADRVVVWLSRAATALEPGGSHRFELAGAPAFVLPHPALLLADPIGKRQAWQVLKALRAVLHTA